MTDAQDAAARNRIAEYQQPMNRELEMLKLWPELVEAVDNLYRQTEFNWDICDLLKRARALDAK